MGVPIIALNEENIWQSETRNQYDGQPDWTSYHYKQANFGLQRILQTENHDYEKYLTTKDEIYISPDVEEQAHFSEGQDIFIVNDENPNGKRITLGERTEIVDKGIRHQKSNPNGLFYTGHSLSVLTKYNIIDYNSVYSKDEKFLKNYVPFADAIDPDDSPFGEGTGGCIVNTDDVNKTFFDIVDYKNNKTTLTKYGNLNRYITFFYKRSSDVDLRTDDDGNPLPSTMILWEYAESDYQYYIGLAENVDGGMTLYELKDDRTVKTTIDSDDTDILNDGEWHHIVCQVTDDDKLILYVDNNVVLTHENSYYTHIYNSDSTRSDFIKIFPGIDDEYLSINDAYNRNPIAAPIGAKLAQIEMYLDVYDPDEDDYLYLTRADDDHTIQKVIKYDISNEGLESTPIVYKVLQNKIYCSMAPDADSIEDNFQEQDELEFSIRVEDVTYKELEKLDEIGIDVTDYVIVDGLIQEFKPVEAQGRSFATKITSARGDIINPNHVIYISSDINNQ